MEDILVTRSSMPSLEEYIKEIRPIWESHWLTNMGVKHQEYQKKLDELKASIKKSAEKADTQIKAFYKPLLISS